MIIFSLPEYEYFASKFLNLNETKLGVIESKIFPDGERYHRIVTNVEQENIILIGGTISDSATLDLFDLGYAITKSGAKSLKIIVPYFGYATMERAIKSGEVVKAKTRASILSAIPKAASANQIWLLDLHSDGIPHYFNENVTALHFYGKKIILEAIKSLNLKEFVLGSTDAGRAKWVASLAQDLEVQAAFVYKNRISGDKTEVSGINADVKDKIVVIYDDMIRTGGSLLSAAEAYLKNGAKEIYSVSTHILLPNNALDKIIQSKLIKKIIGTNSHPNSILKQNQFLEICDISKVFVEHLIELKK